MAQERNPRRVALETLRNIKSNVSVMVVRWDQRQTVYEAGGYRARKHGEKLENQVEEWERLAMFMTAVAHEAEAVRAYAQQQATQLRSGS